MSAARSAPAFDVKLDSIARRAPSRPILCQPPCAAQKGSRLNTPPRNPCSSEPDARQEVWPATSGDTSSGCDHRSRRPQPAASLGTGRSKSNASSPSSRRTTRVRLTPAWPPPAHAAPIRARASALPFLDPGSDRVARHAESARQPAQDCCARHKRARSFRAPLRPRRCYAAARGCAARSRGTGSVVGHRRPARYAPCACSGSLGIAM